MHGVSWTFDWLVSLLCIWGGEWVLTHMEVTFLFFTQSMSAQVARQEFHMAALGRAFHKRVKLLHWCTGRSKRSDARLCFPISFPLPLPSSSSSSSPYSSSSFSSSTSSTSSFPTLHPTNSTELSQHVSLCARPRGAPVPDKPRRLGL